eukprot:7502153-Pyramimonas_sp.AAC.1
MVVIRSMDNIAGLAAVFESLPASERTSLLTTIGMDGIGISSALLAALASYDLADLLGSLEVELAAGMLDPDVEKSLLNRDYQVRSPSPDKEG